MTPFVTHTGIAAPFTAAHVDTDKIIPARFLKTIERTGLGRHLFASLRYDETGAERPDFVLNQAGFRDASILIAGENFGCGSSREHAPWALLDFGLRVIVAPSFADIFHNNCFQNGILAVVLPAETCALLADDARLGGNARLTVDLPRQVIVRPDGAEIRFEIDPARKTALLEGLDEIGRTLRAETAIAAHETRDRAARAWLPAVAV